MGKKNARNCEHFHFQVNCFPKLSVLTKFKLVPREPGLNPPPVALAQCVSAAPCVEHEMFVVVAVDANELADFCA
jgi:hypothetical protein